MTLGASDCPILVWHNYVLWSNKTFPRVRDGGISSDVFCKVDVSVLHHTMLFLRASPENIEDSAHLFAIPILLWSGRSSVAVVWNLFDLDRGSTYNWFKVLVVSLNSCQSSVKDVPRNPGIEGYPHGAHLFNVEDKKDFPN